MNLRFYLDPEAGEPHIYRHGVVEHEVEEVLRAPLETRRGMEGSLVSIGRTEAGRILRVIYTRSGQDAFVITAFEVRGKPLAAFRRRRRRK